MEITWWRRSLQCFPSFQATPMMWWLTWWSSLHSKMRRKIRMWLYLAVLHNPSKMCGFFPLFLFFLFQSVPVERKQWRVQLSLVQSLSRVRLFGTPWIAACQASLSITNSRRSLRLMSIESVMPSSHLILCCPLLPLPPIPPSIRVFSNESALRMRWPKYGVSALASFLPKKSQGWSPSEWIG